MVKKPSEINIDYENINLSKTSRIINESQIKTEEYIQNLEKNIGYNNGMDIVYQQEITGGFSNCSITAGNMSKKKSEVLENRSEKGNI